MTEVVTTERVGRVLLIRMNRPAKRNAVNAAMTQGLDDALNLLDDDGDLWAGVLAGLPNVFSAGTDLASGSGEPTPRGGYYGVVRRRRSTPLVAAVEGGAYGGGFEIVLACDLVVAARNAVFALPEVSRGVVATSGGLFQAPKSLPLNVARELLLTGDPLTAERAWSLGLVNVLTDPGGALAGAMKLAQRVCENAPVSVRASLEALDAVVAADDDHGWDATSKAKDAIAASADSHEGVSAFLNRRQPVWSNK